ncbi:hypothetical protein F3J21_37385, partial [Burkholderia sp. Tr-860]|nr:hypothetical protein [Burkholderia sp. Tr-860]
MPPFGTRPSRLAPPENPVDRFVRSRFATVRHVGSSSVRHGSVLAPRRRHRPMSRGGLGARLEATLAREW